MKYILFEKSAIEIIIGKSEFQSIEFPSGQNFIDYIKKNDTEFNYHYNICAKKSNNGIIFSGSNISNNIIVFDLEQSKLMNRVKDDDSLLLIIQKTLRTAIKIWNRYPFSSSERVNETKSIVFPFIYTDKHRVVIERSTKCDRLTKRGIEKPLLVYNYTDKDSHREEIPQTDILKDAGETYIKYKQQIRNYFDNNAIKDSSGREVVHPLVYTKTDETVSDGDFMYLDYDKRIEKLTTTQCNVVKNTNLRSPIRIEGPAGTGKTASMILRAFFILEEMKKENTPFKIIFLSHSESTNIENKNAFSYINGSEKYLDGILPQQIQFTTLLNYCVQVINIEDTQIIDKNASDAKELQRVYIEEALDYIFNKEYKTYRTLLSNSLKSLFDETKTPKGVLLSMLQHEFSVQIKGRTNGSIEEYKKIESINNAMVLETDRDKEFIFKIFKKYQEMLSTAAVYDIDDITVAALSNLNAPIWRREREKDGYNYIFVDEMHLFNKNEQYCFHYLTKSPEQNEIPICFALDYSQAIGDRGDIQQDSLEREFANAEENNYKTVFRSSQQITDFCAAISAAGSLMFQSDYKNPYHTAMSGFTEKKEALCKKPSLYMYNNETEMISSLKDHINTCKKELNCKNSEIALITFEEYMFDKDYLKDVSKTLNKKIQVINNRYNYFKSNNNDTELLLFDPYSINGLEFKSVILIGVDESRVPKSIGVNDISKNYLKYIAFNQLYLSSSRAKYRLILLGNKLHGISSCLQYAIKNDLLELKE